jgi:GntR family transcriptional repressor for pyruvate dehydrogenase complex
MSSDNILSALRDLIVQAGNRQPDAGRFRLPPERELAAKLNIQRAALRDKLATLEHLGMLDRTQGSGTYVRMLNADLIRLYFDLALALGYINIDELETARELLEREIAHRAAIVGTEADFDELQSLCDHMAGAATVEEQLDADYRFHMRLAQAARNPVISLIIEGLSSVLHTVLARRRRMVRSVPDAAALQNAAHPPIVVALRCRDPDGAMSAMDSHFRVTNELQALVPSFMTAGRNRVETTIGSRKAAHRRGLAKQSAVEPP